jgi:hypothetical protein
MASVWDSVKKMFSADLWGRFTGDAKTDGDAKLRQPPAERLFALHERLTRESAEGKADVRRLTTDALARGGEELINEIICLMFNLSATGHSVRYGVHVHDSKEKLSNALDEVKREGGSLKLHRSVFYVYVSEKYLDAPDYRSLLEKLYARLLQLSFTEGPVRDYLTARFDAVQKASETGGQTFNPRDTEQQTALPYFFPCHISVHVKQFPTSGQADVFVVGRTVLHDLQEIERNERDLRVQMQYFERGQGAQGGIWGSNASLATVLHALTLRGEGEYNGARLRFTAHSFRPFSPVIRREKELYIGTLPPKRTLSIGSAEHDEIQCSELQDQAATLLLDNIGLNESERTWNVDCTPAGKLPHWLVGPNHQLVTEKRDKCVRLLVEKMASLTGSLRRRITRPGFSPHIVLMGRALPLEGGQLSELLSTGDNPLRRLAESLKPKSAVYVQKDVFWLVRSADGKVSALIKRSGWSATDLSQEELNNPLDGVNYVWVKGSSRTLPPGYSGLLMMLPQDEARERLRNELAVDPESGPLPLTYSSFDDKLHPDTWLGSGGVLALKSIEDVGGRPAYALRPIPNALHKYVAFKPPLSLEEGSPSGWQIYDPAAKTRSDLALDAEKGLFIYRDSGRQVVVVGSENTLICGTSYFQIKTSGTPHRDTWAYSTDKEETASTDDGATPEQASRAEFNPHDLAAVKVALLKTPWGGYDITEVSASNVAVHFKLHKGEEKRFLKAYYPRTANNAAREADFYRRFADQAADLFIVPPEGVLLNDSQDRIWGLVFPHHEPLPEVPAESLPRAIAIGYAAAHLSRVLDDTGFINYDIDRTMLCVSNEGRLVIVDFDNVFALYGSKPSPEEATLKAYKDVIESGVLPTKSLVRPPETDYLAEAVNFIERQEALTKIGAAYATYLLGVMLLTILGVNPTGDASTVEVRNEEYPDEANRLTALLRRILNKEPGSRRSPLEVENGLAELASSLAARAQRVREEMSRLGVKLPPA